MPGCTARLAYCRAKPYSSHEENQNCGVEQKVRG
jgi:hypothetical protein